ncbi:MAG: nucleotidyltransferase family protein [Pseudomonadota bacterium]
MSLDSAMIFAAGFGTRMGSLTKDMPKPMLEIGGRPMIDFCIRLLKQAGIRTLVANTHYLPEKIETHLQDQGVITFREDPILETGGGLRNALSHLRSDAVITMNPDVFWQGRNPVTFLRESWKPSMMGLLMLSGDREKISDFSLEKGYLSRKGPYRYTGLQGIRTDMLHDIKEEVFSLNTYWDHLMDRGPLNGVVYDGTWLDIGTQAALSAARAQFK